MTQEQKEALKEGDRLIAPYGDQAVFIELLPDDPEYDCRVRFLDDESPCAIISLDKWDVLP